MSLILKGIDLPSKVDLDYHDNHLVLGGICYALDVDQLVQIPKGHGRLIDMRALFEDLNKYQIEYNADINEVIADAPTILEAEGEEK